MKVQSKDRSVSLNTTETKAFSIQQNAKMFEILSSGMYSNKIQSIIRELCCNAYDAHVAAGKPEVPFEVKLPKSFSPTFSVKDYGIGLSHDDVMQLYCTYGESAKDHSNDFIGGFGLGSKSPFSYTDTFSVVSRFKGTKSFYSAVISEEGYPEIHLMGSEETEEENGLEVSFPVETKDNPAFLKEAQRVMLGFDVKPTCKGVVWNELEYTQVSDLGYKTYKSGDIQGPYVKLGQVLYPIDTSIIPRLSSYRDSILLEVPIGSVAVTTSRESLDYSKKFSTVEVIEKTLDTMEENFYKEVQRVVDKEPSKYLGLVKAASVPKPSFLGKQQVYWRGDKELLKYDGLKFYQTHRNPTKFTSNGPVLNAIKDLKIFIQSQRKGSYDRGPTLETIIANYDCGNESLLWVRLECNEKDNPLGFEKEEKALARLLKDLEGVPVLYLKDLFIKNKGVKKPKVAGTTKSSVKIRVNGLSVYCERDLGKIEISDELLKAGGVWTKWTSKGKIENGRFKYRNYLLSNEVFLLTHGLSERKVYLVPSMFWKDFEKAKGWVNFEDRLKELTDLHAKPILESCPPSLYNSTDPNFLRGVPKPVYTQEEYGYFSKIVSPTYLGQSREKWAKKIKENEEDWCRRYPYYRELWSKKKVRTEYVRLVDENKTLKEMLDKKGT